MAVGGDGTVQEVINGLASADAGCVLGIVPAGAGNDLARDLRIPRDHRRALALALHEPPRRIDVGQATGADGRVRRFGAAGGAGFDAQVAAAMARSRARWQRGRLGYALVTLSELRRYRNARVAIEWEGPDGGTGNAELPVLMVAFANGAYYGGGMRIAPAARPDDGHLDLCIVGDVSRLEAVRQLPGMYRGAHVAHPAVRMERARRLRLGGDEAPVHLDGDPFGRLPLDVVVLQGALLVAAPS